MSIPEYIGMGIVHLTTWDRARALKRHKRWQGERHKPKHRPVKRWGTIGAARGVGALVAWAQGGPA